MNIAIVFYTRHQFFSPYFISWIIVMKLLILALFVFVSWQIVIAKYSEQVLSVDSYGAIANDSSVQAAVKNSQAISQASIPS